MFVAAMIDLGADPDALEKALDSLSADGFFVEIGRVKKSGIDCCDFRVRLDDDCENHDHDMDYLYGNLTPAAGSGCSCHEEPDREEHHCHCHEEGHDGEAHHCCRQEKDHHHTHRGLAEILPMIDACDMTETAKSWPAKYFGLSAKRKRKPMACPLTKSIFMKWERLIPLWTWWRLPLLLTAFTSKR